MKKFLIKSLTAILLTAIAVAVITELLLPVLVSKNTYLAATIDKQNRLKNLPGNRIIITGGSNAAFSVDGKKIGERLGMPVVNMGVHAGLGLTYMLNETASGIKKGDVVVLTTEHYLGEGFVRLQALAAAANPASVQYMGLTPFNFIRLWVFKIQICFRLLFYGGESLDDLYIRSGFNVEGDLVSHLNKTDRQGQAISFHKLVFRDYSPEIGQINRFIRECKQKGVQVYYIFPCLPYSEYLKYKSEIDSWTKLMKEQLECPVLGTQQEFFYPDELIYDARYHLRKEGRADRSEKMARLLEEVISTQP
jgi:hypothetical protein